MTLEEFFDNLARVRNEFDWRVEPNAAWYGDGRGSPRAWLRARPKSGIASGAILEPIGAVCYALTGEPYGEKSWQAAARELELAPDTARDLNAAADARTWTGSAGGRRPAAHLEALRERLLGAVEVAVHH